MARATAVQLTGIERTFDQDQIIVSKTDLTGHLTYANELFLGIARYAEDEVLGQPHSLVRHPDMPRAIFDLLWETLKAGREIFAFVINRGKDGSHYWVLAHVTPTLVDGTRPPDNHRRVPDPAPGGGASLRQAVRRAGRQAEAPEHSGPGRADL